IAAAFGIGASPALALAGVVKHIADRRAAGAKVLVTAWTEGSLERLLQVLNEHGMEKVKPIEALKDVGSLARGEAGVYVVPVYARTQNSNPRPPFR
ncbi:hypothetical protein ACC848_38740, partial [Rhizobium johnstonii]